jgi:hypothetical protein
VDGVEAPQVVPFERGGGVEERVVEMEQCDSGKELARASDGAGWLPR